MRRAPAFPALLIILLAPNILLLWTVDFLPFVDLPQYLGIATVVHNYGNPRAGFDRIYTLNLFPAPNTAHLLFCHYLAYVVGVETANRIFVSLYAALLPLSALHLIRTLGGNRYFALMSLPFTYNYDLMWGWLGFALAIPLYLFCLSLGLRYVFDGDRRSGAALAILLAAVFFTHVQVYLLAILSLVIVAAIGKRGRIAGAAAKCLPLLPSLCVYSLWAAGSVRGGRGLGAELAFNLATTWSRLLVNIVSIGPRLMPRLSLDYAVLGLFLAIILGNLARHRKEIGGRARDGKTAAAIAVLAAVTVLYLVLPTDIHSLELTFINTRLLVFAPLLLLCAAAALTPGLTRTTAVLVVALCAVGTLNVAVPFLRFDREARPARELIAGLDENKYLAGLIYDARSAHIPFNVYMHFACYYQVLKLGVPAYSCAYAKYTPVQYRQPPALPKIDDWRPWESLFPRGWQRYDYLLVRGVPFEEHMKYIVPLKLVARKGAWSVYANESREDRKLEAPPS